MKSPQFPRVAFDVSSFIWTNLLQGTDPRAVAVEHEGKVITINTADYGYDKVLRAMREVLDACKTTPIHCLLVTEGLQSKSRRVLVYPGYKAGGEKHPLMYEQFQLVQAKLCETWRDHGAIVLRQDYAEGDDTLAYLAENIESDLVIASNDGDLAKLVGRNRYGAQIRQYRLHAWNVNPIEPYPLELLTLYKALVGDTSDKIKGVRGFGEKAWETLYNTIGVEKMRRLEGFIRNNTPELVEDLQPGLTELQKVAAGWPEACACYYVALLHPEWVDTFDHALQITPGMPKATKATSDLGVYTSTVSLITRRNFAQAAPWIRTQLAKSPWVALDIEAAPTQESVQWAEAAGKDEDFVDVLGARTTGLSLTFGANCEHTVYMPTNHAASENLSFSTVWDLVQEIQTEVLIQNAMFELPVLYMESGGQHRNREEWGFIPNVRDTAIEANYVDENNPVGLKWRSHRHLGYTQQTYDEVTTIEVVGTERPFPGGALVSQGPVERNGEMVECSTWRYRMDELPADHVLSYGADDTICTAALHNYYRLVLELEHAWKPFLDIEVDAGYLNAASYLDGVPFSVKRMQELVEKDKVTMTEAWDTIAKYLVEKGWEGTVCPQLNAESTPSDWKTAFTIVTNHTIQTAVRTPSKLQILFQQAAEALPEAIRLSGQIFVSRMGVALERGDYTQINDLLRQHFKGVPTLNLGSPLQKQRLLYETLGFEIKVRNKPTAKMKAARVPGTPKTDALALKYCLRDAKQDETPTRRLVLEALQVYMTCMTKFNLFYNKYPGLLHWIDGNLHPSFRQSATNTRRHGCAAPNFQQMPKHAKVEGQAAEFRECIIPHKKNAVVASLDFKAQELVSIAFQSQDTNMLLCYGNVPPDQRKDMHIITGRRILELVEGVSWTYEEFVQHYSDKHDAEFKKAKTYRDLGKKVNFTTEYGAMAEKLSQTMLVDEDIAQQFIDAKEESFPRVDEWKEEVKAEAREFGYVSTLSGVRRHLREALNSSDRYEASKAERQAVNFKVQSSCAEQTKKALGRAWRRGVIFRYDCRFYGPIHDETVWSCVADQLSDFLPEVHACMVGSYGGYDIPIESSISFGPDFGRQIEIGERATPEAVKMGFEKMAEDYGVTFA